MTDTKKFSDEERAQIAALRQELTVLAHEYGQLSFTKRMVERELQKTEAKYDSLLSREEILVKTLNEKYGTGSLNLDTGEFIPAN